MEQITFCSRKDVIHVDKTNGTSVNYYLKLPTPKQGFAP